LNQALQRIAACQLVITDPPKVTPLAFSLLVDKLRERLSNEALKERVARLQAQLEEAADKMDCKSC
jgi:ATP-dependent Lhr-like helicase